MFPQCSVAHISCLDSTEIYVTCSLVRITLLITVLVPLNYDLCFCRCAHAEYEINGQCCPMCAPGNYVVWHCTDDSSTKCVPCPEFTYIDDTSNTECFSCNGCDENRGIRVIKECTQSSDTVCGPLERFYCIEKKKISCIFAVQHSECRPGQYIKQAGTEFRDTVCNHCPVGSYSNGTLCNLHTKCESLGKITVKTGTQTSDAECSDGTPLLIVLSVIIVFVVLFVIIVVIFIFISTKTRIQYRGTSSQDLNMNMI